MAFPDAPAQLPNLTPAQLLAGAQVIADRTPNAELVKNQVGNLAIVDDGEYIGSINLRTGEVDYFADRDADEDEPPTGS